MANPEYAENLFLHNLPLQDLTPLNDTGTLNLGCFCSVSRRSFAPRAQPGFRFQSGSAKVGPHHNLERLEAIIVRSKKQNLNSPTNRSGSNAIDPFSTSGQKCHGFTSSAEVRHEAENES